MPSRRPEPAPPQEGPHDEAHGDGRFLNDTAALRFVVRGVIACVLGERADHPDVEDCTHETLRRAIEGRERLRPGEPVRPWVIGIARHVALDTLRARKRDRRAEPMISPELTESGAIRGLLDRLADPGPAPDERVVDADRARRVRAALAKLPDGQRAALTMFHEEGAPYQDISARLQVPIGTVATWIARGRRAIAEALDEGREP